MCVLSVIFSCRSAPNLLRTVGGLLAAGLLRLGEIGSRSSWENIFLVGQYATINLLPERPSFYTEGIITMGFGLLSFPFFPTDPERTKMLNEEERQLAIARMYADQPEVGTRLIHEYLIFMCRFHIDQGYEGINKPQIDQTRSFQCEYSRLHLVSSAYSSGKKRVDLVYRLYIVSEMYAILLFDVNTKTRLTTARYKDWVSSCEYLVVAIHSC